MSDDSYLWDRRGTPDPFVEKLERALVAKRAEVLAAAGQRRRRGRTIAGVLLASAAAVLVVWGLPGGEADANVGPVRDAEPSVAAEIAPTEEPAAEDGLAAQPVEEEKVRSDEEELARAGGGRRRRGHPMSSERRAWPSVEAFERVGLTVMPRRDVLQLHDRTGVRVGLVRECGGLWWLRVESSAEWWAFLTLAELAEALCRYFPQTSASAYSPS